MRSGLIVVALAAALSVSGCGFMNAGGAAEARWAALERTRAAKAQAEANPGLELNKICKTMTVTGSNLPQRVCSTQAEWDAFDRAGREGVDAMNEARRSGSVRTGIDGGSR